MIVRLVMLLALCACGSKKKAPNGELCHLPLDCESGYCVRGRCESGLDDAACVNKNDCQAGLQCLLQRCRSRVKKGGKCAADYECDLALRCRNQQCLDEEGMKLAAERAALEQRARDADQERRMLEESGAPAAGSGAEKAALPPGPGTRIRTVTISGKRFAIASCKSDERLESGGCKADQVLSSYPSGHSELDTVGARWNCTTHTAAEVTAFALCSKLP